MGSIKSHPNTNAHSPHIIFDPVAIHIIITLHDTTIIPPLCLLLTLPAPLS